MKRRKFLPIQIDLRDALYDIFTQCLSSPQSAVLFENLAAACEPKNRGYVQDRAQRYRQVLGKWAQRKKACRTPRDEALALSELLFNHGLFFDCHEYLESSWKAAQGPEKTCLQGLIQIAAGFHKLELDPKARAGARELLEKGQDKLKKTAGAILSEAVTNKIIATLEPATLALRSINTKPVRAPKLHWP